MEIMNRLKFKKIRILSCLLCVICVMTLQVGAQPSKKAPAKDIKVKPIEKGTKSKTATEAKSKKPDAKANTASKEKTDKKTDKKTDAKLAADAKKNNRDKTKIAKDKIEAKPKAKSTVAIKNSKGDNTQVDKVTAKTKTKTPAKPAVEAAKKNRTPASKEQLAQTKPATPKLKVLTKKQIADSIAREKWLIKKNALAAEKLANETKIEPETKATEKEQLTDNKISDATNNTNTITETNAIAISNPVVDNKPKVDSEALANVSTNQLLNQSEDIIALFAAEDYKQVMQLGSKYLKKAPNDTVIIIKTGLSSLFENKYKDAFELIDKTLVVKDTLVRFYATVPYIYKAAKGNNVQQQIVKHCKDLDPNSVWTLFAETSYYSNTENEKEALQSGKKMHELIRSTKEADALGFLYPYLLQKYDKPDEAIRILEERVLLFPEAYSLQNYLFDHYRKQGKNAEAYILIKKLCIAQPSNEEFVEEKIEVCMLMGKYEEACELLKQANVNNLMDEKVYKVGCPTDFYKVPLQANTTYVYKVNKGGNLYSMNLTIEPLLDNNLALVYKTDTKKPIKGTVTLLTAGFDTSRNLDFDFYNKAQVIDSSSKSYLWLSKVCYREMQNNKQVYLNLGNGVGLFNVIEKDYFTENEDQNLFMDRINVNNSEMKFVQTIHLYNMDTAEQLWVLDDEKNPIVVKMDGAYTMELSEVVVK